MIRNIPLFLAAAIFSLSACATDENIDCDNAKNTYEMNYCAGKEREIVEKKLATYLAKAKEEYAAEANVITALEASQVSWIAYRDSYCDSIYEIWSEGSIRGMMYSECIARLNQQRIHNIWEDYLVTMEGDSILPEPK
jgi:uncharacterized protein YecT (DUF1311 family)